MIDQTFTFRRKFFYKLHQIQVSTFDTSGQSKVVLFYSFRFRIPWNELALSMWMRT